MKSNRIIMFTKPWMNESLESLADFVAGLGIDGIELPIRDGYQVTPENIVQTLPKAQQIFKERELVISSIAGSIDERIIGCMGDSGISLLRVCESIDMSIGYFASVRNIRDKIISQQTALRSNKVVVGVQNHYGYMIASAIGLHHLIDEIPADIAGGVLDFAHCGLDGEPVDMALDILKDRLVLANFKSAFRKRVNGPDEIEAEWQVLWSTSGNSTYSWKSAISELVKIGYTGDLCLPAEYGRIGNPKQLMGSEVITRVKSDIATLKSLLNTDSQ